MKGILPILLASLLIWILSGQWLIKKNCPCKANAEKDNSLNISEIVSLSITCKSTFSFDIAGFESQKPVNTHLQSSLEATPPYLLSKQKNF